MKTFKKLFSVSAIVALLGTLVPMYAFGATYTAELVQAYDYAHDHGITTMSSIDNADMYGNLTRIAMAKMLANYAIDVLGLTPDTTKECTFPDVTAALDTQYDNGVTKACQLGLMGVGIEKFNPNGTVTRAEFGTAFSRALNANDADKVAEMNKADPYYKEHLNFLKEQGIMNDISNPNMLEVRGYVMLMMMRSDDSYTPTEGCSAEELLKCLTADDYDACVATCSNEQEPEEEDKGDGFATVKKVAAEDTQYVALNAVDKKIGTIKVTAGDADTILSNIEITKAGLGLVSDIEGIQLMQGNEYVTNQVKPNANKVAKLRFSPAITLKAGESMNFDVVVSLNGKDAGGQHEFTVTALNVANGKSEGTPIKLGSLVTTNYSVATNTVSIEGNSVTAGDTAKELATVKVTPSADAIVNSITLTTTVTTENLYDAFSNVKAYINNELVGKVAVNGETIVISDLNAKVDRKDDLEVVLKGDIIYVGSLTAIPLYVDSNHVNAVEISTNERMSNGNIAAENVNINGIGLTLTNNGEKQTVALGTKNVNLLDMKVASAADVDITSFYVDFGTTPANVLNSFDDLVIDVDGTEYDITTGTQFSGNAVRFTKKADYLTISANGSAKVKVSATIEGTGTSSYTLTFGVAGLKNKTTNTTVSASKTKPGHATTIKNAGTLNTTKGSVEGTTISNEARDILAFNLAAKSENITVNSVEFNLAMVAAVYDEIESVELYQGTTQLGETLDKDDLKLASAGNYTGKFVSLGQELKADATALPFTLRVKLSKTDDTIMGQNITATIAAGNIIAKGKTSKVEIKNTSAINGKPFQVTTSKSNVSIKQDGKMIYVTVTNNSDYKMVLANIKLDVNGTIVNGENVLKNAAVAGYTIYKDTTDGDVIVPTTANVLPGQINESWNNGVLAVAATGTATIPQANIVGGTADVDVIATAKTAGTAANGSITITGDGTKKLSELNTDYTFNNDIVLADTKTVTIILAGGVDNVDANYIVIDDTYTFAIEMDTVSKIENDFYEAVAKSLTFYYVDNYNEGDHVTATAITEKYNENK